MSVKPIARLMLPAAAAFAVIVTAGIAHSMVTRTDASTAGLLTASTAEDLFPDAPDGVDAMVTGPVSVSFKQRQAELGCAKARWPNVPAGCYPKN